MVEKKKTEKKDKKNNKMREIMVDSVVLHASSADTQKLERIRKLLKLISGQEPVQTLARKRIPTFKIRPGLNIGYKVTVRKQKAIDLFKNLIQGTHTIKKKQFNPGYFNFGIKEYIEIPNLAYQRDIGIMGFDVAVTLKRRGFRVRDKKLKKSAIGHEHKITKEETINFFIENFKLNIEEK